MKSLVLLLLFLAGSSLLAQTQPAAQPPEQQSGAQPQAQSNVAATLQVFAYPKANQAPEKQAQDENECFQWAQGQGAGTPPAQSDKQAQHAQATDNVKRAYSACMESRN